MKVETEISCVRFVLEALQINSFIRLDLLRLDKRNSSCDVNPVVESGEAAFTGDPSDVNHLRLGAGLPRDEQVNYIISKLQQWPDKYRAPCIEERRDTWQLLTNWPIEQKSARDAKTKYDKKGRRGERQVQTGAGNELSQVDFCGHFCHLCVSSLSFLLSPAALVHTFALACLALAKKHAAAEDGKHQMHSNDSRDNGQSGKQINVNE